MNVTVRRTTPDSYTWIVKQAYNGSLIRIKNEELKMLPYWWNIMVEEEREECKKMRRKLNRMTKRNIPEITQVEQQEQYKRDRNELRRLIATSKSKH